MKEFKNSQSGQIGVIVLLVMTAMLTIGVGAVSRSSQDLRITRQEAESTLSLNAAEAGIEAALYQISLYEEGEGESLQQLTQPKSLTLGEDQNEEERVVVNYQISPQDFVNTTADEGEIITINLQDSNSSGVFKVAWPTNIANNANCNNIDFQPASLLISVIDQDPTQSLKYGYTKCGSEEGLDSVGLQSDLDVSYLATTQMVNIRVLGSPTDINVWSETAPSLPIQSYQITSRTTSANTSETKVVSLQRHLPSAPQILDYALVSGTTITNN